MSYKKHFVSNDIAPSEMYAATAVDSDTDTISRSKAIDAMAELQGRASSKAELKGISKAWKMIKQLPPVQPETAKRIVGKSKDGMTLWYQCDMCNEPVDAQDNFCRECGRRLIDE